MGNEFYKSEIKLFSGEPVSNFIKRTEAQIQYEIEHMDTNELLNADASSFINYLIEKYKIEPLQLSFDEIYVGSEERDVPVEQHPRDFTVWNMGMGNNAIKRLIITYRIPFSGNSSLLVIAPSSFATVTRCFYTKEQTLCFDIIDFYNEPERIKKEAQLYIDYAKEFLSYLQADIHKFNCKLGASCKIQKSA